jgi:hypothetical protein
MKSSLLFPYQVGGSSLRKTAQVTVPEVDVQIPDGDAGTGATYSGNPKENNRCKRRDIERCA